VYILGGSVGVELAFTTVDPLQQIVSAIKYQKFDNGTFPRISQSLAGWGQSQEFIIGIEVPQHISSITFTFSSHVPMSALH
jgi:hypothetical protein